MKARLPAPDSRLRQSLLRLLAATARDEERLLRALDRRAAAGGPVYSSLLFVLAHLSFSEADAERHFRKVLVHRDTLRSELGRDPGIRVAVLDYFQNVDRELRNPLVIEHSLFESTERSAVTDGLTGVFNHAYFKEALRREVQRARRHSLKLCLALFDIDNFKRLNDTRGHPAGDRVLAKTAALVRESARTIDVVARYGGEEFALVLPETPRTGGFVVAERVRARVEAHFHRVHGPRVTVSGGVATWPEDAQTADALVRKADQGLYRAKALGKNRVVLSRGERRRHPRQPAGRRVTLAARGSKRAAHARNVSSGGLLLSLREPVPVGSSVSIVLRSAGQATVGLRGEVVHVDHVGTGRSSRYEAGVRFLPRSGQDVARLVLRRGPA
jgi:diguanylate cyclase (GGDEF)-like protein